MPRRQREQRLNRMRERWGAPPAETQSPDFGSNTRQQEEVRPPAPVQAPTPAPAPAPAAPGQRAPAAPAVATPAVSERMRTTLDPQLAALEGAKTDAARQTASTNVANFTRGNLTDPMEVQRYLARTDISAADKTATMGRLAVASARSEFLAGWSYEGGVEEGGSEGWENTGSNRGAFPSHYQDQVQTYGRTKGAEWCTSFAGSMLKSVGMQTPTGAEGEEANSMFWSGYRLNTWAESGETVAGAQATPTEDRVAAGQNGAQYVASDRWSNLRAQLKDTKDPLARTQAASNFTAAFSVQPGDVIVLGSGNDYRSNSKSHTVMVESWDPATQTLTTIEGNAGNAVSTRRLDLKNPDDVGTIVSSVRVGFDQYLDPSAQQKIADDAGTPEAAARVPVTAESLMTQANAVNERVAGAAIREGFVNGTATDTAYTWQHGAAGTNRELSVQ